MKTIALTLLASAAVFAQTAQKQNAAQSTASRGASERIIATHPAEVRPVQNVAKTPVSKSAPAKAGAPVTSIPDGAKLVEPNLYRYTDTTGKTWMYRRTPFGISRWEDQPNAAPAPAAAAPPTSVTDLGDSVRFERNTAFGKSQWIRKKSDLTAEEKALLDGQQKDSEPKDGQHKPAALQTDNKVSERR